MARVNGADPDVAAERRSGGGSGIGIFVLGALIGAGLALLYAPQSGEETRRSVARSARRVRRKARDLTETAQDAARTTREALERRLARHHRVEREDAYDGEDDGV